MSSSSTDSAHNLLITLVAIVLGVVLINTILMIWHIRDFRDMNEKSESSLESWPNGMYNGLEQDTSDMGQKTKRACSCVSYGTNNDVNMPFNDDSSLYKESASNMSGNGHFANKK